MFDQTFIDHKGKRRPWTYLLGLAGELFALGVLLLLPLIYTDQLAGFGLSHLRITLPRPAQPEPPPAEMASRPATRATRVFNQNAIYAPIKIPDGTPIFVDPGEPVLASYAPSTGGVPGLGDLALPGNSTIVAPPPPRDPPQRRPAPEPAQVQPNAPVPMGGKVQDAKIIRRIVPIYPPLARQARVQGTVKLLGIIARDGSIQQLQVISGHPLLVRAAVEAVRQWLYHPTLLNGEAVEVMAPIDVIFTLGQ